MYYSHNNRVENGLGVFLFLIVQAHITMSGWLDKRGGQEATKVGEERGLCLLQLDQFLLLTGVYQSDI